MRGLNNMRKTILRIITAAVALCCAFSAFGCNKPADAAETDVTVWTARGLEKIRNDIDYSGRYGSKTLYIDAFKNENEAGQIILSADPNAKRNVTEYTIDLNDLSDGNGHTLPKAAFTVYNQKYIEVQTIQDKKAIEILGATAGWYPDALLPFEAAAEYGENSLRWRNGQKYLNQGIWINCKPDKNQAAGVYRGNFTVTADGKTHVVPVEVEVYDYTLSDTTRTKSSFQLSPWISYSEFEGTGEMMETYYDFLLEHRLSAQDLPVTTLEVQAVDDAYIEKWLDCAVKYTRDPRCTSFNLPYIRTSRELKVVRNEDGELIHLFIEGAGLNGGRYVVGRNDQGKREVTEAQVKSAESKWYSCYDEAGYVKLLRAMAERSVREGVNLFEKAGTYFIYFDEFTSVSAPTASYTLQRAYDTHNYMAAGKDAILNDLIKEENWLRNVEDKAAYAAENGVSYAEFKAALLKSIRSVKHKAVSYYQDEMIADRACWCPQIDYYDKDAERQKYIDASNEYTEEEGGGERWTYTCIFPQTPYPTFHTEDALISSRLLYWMMYDYDIVGNLFWTSTLFARPVDNGYMPSMDYYGLVNKYKNCNGDGYLMYPGRPYGVYGPVDTIRLQSIRDGIEEYDLLYDLEDMYRERGVTGEQFDSVYKLLNQSLYTGTVVRYRNGLYDSFTAGRKKLAELLTLAESGIAIEACEIDKGEGTVTLSAPAATAVKAGGEAVSGVEIGAIKRYAIPVALDEAVNFLELEFTRENETVMLDLPIGNRVRIVSPETLYTLLNDRSTYTDATCAPDGGKISFTFDALTPEQIEDTNGKQFIELDISSLSVTKDEAYLTFEVAYTGDGPLEAEISFPNLKVGENVYAPAGNAVLNGDGRLTRIRIPVSNISFTNANAKATKVRIYLLTTDAVSIELGDLTLEA